jgi:hypothetical protein
MMVAVPPLLTVQIVTGTVKVARTVTRSLKSLPQ